MGHDHDNDNDDHHIFGAVFPRALYGRPTVKTPLLTMSKSALSLLLSCSVVGSMMIMMMVVMMMMVDEER